MFLTLKFKHLYLRNEQSAIYIYIYIAVFIILKVICTFNLLPGQLYLNNAMSDIIVVKPIITWMFNTE